ncbi:MAG: hypothetical protein SVR94_14550 [Pseudomonadota bacterium]|nr:hypothetical protein [Pseudomonadota bacterium]
MKEYLDQIFDAKTIDDVCTALQKSLSTLRDKEFFKNVPAHYENITATNPVDIQDWFDEMKNDEQVGEEGSLKEIYGLYQAALQQLRRLGFHRE